MVTISGAAMAATFPFVEVLSYETGLPVKVVAWHVRSVRPIREVADDDENVTRIEFTNAMCWIRRIGAGSG
jgi:hypothetical protein